MKFVFDGSFNGLLTSVFEAFERKQFSAQLVENKHFQPSLIEEHLLVDTIPENAERVYKGLASKLGKSSARQFYVCFLSEEPEAIAVLFRLIIRIFGGANNVLENYGDPDVLHFFQTLKKISRERHRMKAFVRFQKDETGLFFAVVEPDFNVLPLIVTFFRKRYADQRWLIYDVKRKYGIMYQNNVVEEVEMQAFNEKIATPAIQIEMDENDALYQQLWKRYFKATNIEARKNMKLHLQYVPRRYWKYLVEKQ